MFHRYISCHPILNAFEDQNCELTTLFRKYKYSQPFDTKKKIQTNKQTKTKAYLLITYPTNVLSTIYVPELVTLAVALHMCYWAQTLSITQMTVAM